MTENITILEDYLPKKIKKQKKKEIQPKISSKTKKIQPPEKSLEQKELDGKLFDLLAKRRLKAHMKLEKWRNQALIGSFGF